MSVLIHMEMPKSCFECRFSIDGFCYASGHVNIRANDERQITNYCPLVPVQPHGRLIDADALRQSIKESIGECRKWADEVEGGEMYARVSQSLGTFVECSLRVKAAPTIIQAEEGG